MRNRPDPPSAGPWYIPTGGGGGDGEGEVGGFGVRLSTEQKRDLAAAGRMCSL